MCYCQCTYSLVIISYPLFSINSYPWLSCCAKVRKPPKILTVMLIFLSIWFVPPISGMLFLSIYEVYLMAAKPMIESSSTLSAKASRALVKQISNVDLSTERKQSLNQYALMAKKAFSKALSK